MNKKLIISILLTIIYAVITLIAVLHHEIWADEAQVWQLCRYLSVPELISHLHNEGHPSLFYLMVMPFAKLTTDIVYMQLICWLSMCIAVFLLLYKSPFSNFVKFAIISSAGFLYFLPVMARNYAIIPVLIFLAAILYSKQKEHPVLYGLVIALIANTHAIMLGFAFVMFCVFIYDNFKYIKEKKNIFAAAIIFLGIAACILQLHDTTSSNFYINFNFANLMTKTTNVLTLFFANSIFFELQQGNYNYTVFAKAAISLFVICFISIHCFLLKYSKKLFIVSVFSLVFQLLIYVILYSHSYLIYVTRIFSYYIIMIFCVWVGMSVNENMKMNKKLTFVLAVFFLFTFINGLIFYIQDYKYNYAGGKDTSKFIQENIPQNSKLFIDNEPFCISLAYYLNSKYNLFSVIREENLKYVKWDKTSFYIFDDNSWGNYAEYMQSKNPDFKIYVIRSKYTEQDTGLNVNQEDKFKKIFSSGITIDPVEGYNIYEYIGT